jgi:tetratricopeptide (TPR) repeat protein
MPVPAARLARAVIAAALLVCVAAAQALVDMERPAVQNDAGGRLSAAAAVAQSVTGQIRDLLADYLWLRVNEYAHHRRFEDGVLNRDDDEAILPLVRLIAWLDPHFVDAYALGGHWLAFHFNRPREAVAFYEEGIRNNPADGGLWKGVAFVYWRLLHNDAAAATSAEQAARLAGDDGQVEFDALWLEAHILQDAGDRAGEARIWHRVAGIPGFARTAEHFLAQLARPTAGGRPGAPAAERTRP